MYIFMPLQGLLAQENTVFECTVCLFSDNPDHTYTVGHKPGMPENEGNTAGACRDVTLIQNTVLARVNHPWWLSLYIVHVSVQK